MTEIELFAKQYFKLGLNVTCISNQLNEHNFYCRNILKTPNHEWKHLFSTRQSESEINSLQWQSATGVGCVSGFNDLRVIDIDGCNNYDFLDSVLDFLDLPKNYEWVTLSGSKNGFHIFINSYKLENLSAKDVVTTMPPKDDYKHLFEKIEILWNTHVVLPPSLHNSGGDYSFVFCKFPRSRPLLVKRRIVLNFIDAFLETEKTIVGRGYGQILFTLIPPNIPSDLNEDYEKQLKDKTVICVIDIETDGLPSRTPEGINYPNIVQVAWILMDSEGNIYKKDSDLINYPNIIYTDAFKVNKIDIEIVKKIGKQPEDVFRRLISDVRISDYIVAHNVNFDLPILRNQLSLYRIPDAFKDKTTICTMKETVDFCNIENYDGKLKYPKLTELYEKLFRYEIDQIHNAEADVLITAKCFKELLLQNIIDLDE